MSSQTLWVEGTSAGQRWRRSILWSILGVSLILMVATPIAIARGRSGGDDGIVPGLAQRWRGTIVKFDATAPIVPMVAVRSARLADQRVTKRGPAPMSIRIPSIDVNASIVPVGVDRRGPSVQIPTNIRVLGWYRFGPSPGGSGSAVIVGHVDSSAQGAGAFFHLRDLRPGAAITVRFRDGSLRIFYVVARRAYPKSALPDAIFAPRGPPRLALVTCGGAFDVATRHYADNVVVYAVPSGDARSG